ncbi:unnamed protein product, partial [Rotaria sp. Silwood2]
ECLNDLPVLILAPVVIVKAEDCV